MFDDYYDIIETADFITATPTPPYPGTPLKKGSSGANVSLMQIDLNAIRQQLYPSLNPLTVDGKFGTQTETTVKQYQGIKGLKIDGIIGKNTWDAIVTDYANLPDPATDVYPGTPLSVGSKGPYVLNMQTKLNQCATVYTAINKLTLDGNFGNNTKNATIRFQKQFALTADGVIGEKTWNAIVAVSQAVGIGNPSPVLTKYPGYVISKGSTGDNVRFIQSYMNTVGIKTGSWTPVTVDGNFGTLTDQMVKSFQAKYKLTVDGKVGSSTWSKMITEFNGLI